MIYTIKLIFIITLYILMYALNTYALGEPPDPGWGGAAVPEPATITLLGSAAIGFYLQKKLKK